MLPSLAQQHAMQARLNMLLGRDAFDSLFPGVEFGELRKDTIDVWVRSDRSACHIESRHLAVLATVVENTLRTPVRYVNLRCRQ